MKALLIAEKPSLMNTIKEFYNKHKNDFDIDITFMAQAGHLVGLKAPKEIDPVYEKWSMSQIPIKVPYVYKVNPGKNNLLSDIRKEVKTGGYDFIINAGDPDQEGELLIRLVLEYIGNKLPVKRFWSNDLTEGAVVQALHNLKNDSQYDGLYHAALTRQHEDYDFGMNLTEAISLKSNTLYKLGRVKAGIIRILVDRELAIENFKPHTDYKKAFIYNDNLEFVCNDEVFSSIEDLRKGFTIPTSATVTDYKCERKQQKAPKLFKLSTIQTAAHSQYNFSGSRTLSTIQNLYEKKYVSYPRTDCEYISSATDVSSILRTVCKVIDLPEDLETREINDVMHDTTYANDKAIASEGHTGLIPTGQMPNLSSLTDDERKIYDLICRRFLAIFAVPKSYDSYKITAKANDDIYVFSGTNDIYAGFEIVLNPNYKKKEINVPNMKVNDVLSPIEFREKEIVAKPPARFNDGSIIKALDNPDDYKDENGKKVKYKLGTPATRATIIDDCATCGYFEKKKGQYFATDKAKLVIKNFGDLPIFNVTTSAEWETLLEKIRNNELDYNEVVDSMTKGLYESLDSIKNREVEKMANSCANASSAIGTCPLCGGSIFENKKAYACSNWNKDPKCNFVIWKEFTGSKISKTDVKKLVEGKTIKKNLKSKAGKEWTQNIKYNASTNKIDFVK